MYDNNNPKAAAAAAAKSLQSCPTLCDPIDGSPPGSPVPGILQARTLEWVPKARRREMEVHQCKTLIVVIQCRLMADCGKSKDCIVNLESTT